MARQRYCETELTRYHKKFGSGGFVRFVLVYGITMTARQLDRAHSTWEVIVRNA